jgi:RNA-directed DNA polymerase
MKKMKKIIIVRSAAKLSEEKTRIIEFESSQTPLGRNGFDFLGFEFRWGRDHSGKPRVKRRTFQKKLRISRRLLTIWCRERRFLPSGEMLKGLNAKLRGYYNYYGVIGNYPRLEKFYKEAIRVCNKWLNRRS